MNISLDDAGLAAAQFSHHQHLEDVLGMWRSLTHSHPRTQPDCDSMAVSNTDDTRLTTSSDNISPTINEARQGKGRKGRGNLNSNLTIIIHKVNREMSGGSDL